MSSIRHNLYLAASLLAAPLPATAQDDSGYTDKLESLRQDIRQVESSIRGATDEKQFLLRELEDNEKNAAVIQQQLGRLDNEIAAKVGEIRELQKKQEDQLNELQAQRELLGEQIRAAYITGRSDYLKLLLNQENPQRIGRVLAFYDFHNRTRTEQIHETLAKLNAISTLENTIRKENDQLVALKQQQQTQLANLQESRNSRQAIIDRLDSFISEQGLELQRLQTQEQELKKLITNIEDSGPGGIEFFEDIAPFDTLRGTLKWPVDGEIIHRYGSPKKGDSLDWQGMLFSVPAGTEVKAISTGKVVFADWFKNLGLLIIIEHGDGYMSLYGHNQSLNKKQGDWVLPGEPIALAGDSGGQSRSALYFEIRHRGKPVNPVKWCRR